MVQTRRQLKEAAGEEKNREKNKEKKSEEEKKVTKRKSVQKEKPEKPTKKAKKDTTEALVPTSPKKAKKSTAKKASSPKPKRAAKNKKEIVEVPTPVEAPVSSIIKNTDGRPVLWETKLEGTSYGIYVDDNHVYSGSENGVVKQFDKEGKLLKQFRLPAGVKCIVGDGPFLYVGCNDGSLYDITVGVPRLMARVEEFQAVYWIDVHNGLIAASDSAGKVALINAEGETIWVHKDNNAGWMCRLDDSGVTKRALDDGTELWRNDAAGYILFGQQDNDFVYSSAADWLCKLDKKTGVLAQRFDHGGASCGVTEDSKLVISGYPFAVFKSDGEKLYNYPLFTEHVMSMATRGNFEVYTVGDKLTKYDFSPESMAKVTTGSWRSQSFSAQTVAEILPETSVAETTQTTGGVMCECVKEGGKLRVRVIAAGYDSSWNVQFPRAIREEGTKYIVEKIITQGSFYRAWGEIKKIKQ